MSILEKNLESLQKSNKELSILLSKHQISPADFVLEKAQSGDVNLIYKNTPLHCKKSPQQEAVRTFNEIKPDENTVVIILGIGLGYSLKRFFTSSKAKIIIYEPEINILRFTLQSVDFAEELSSERVYITQNIEELDTALSTVYKHKDKIVYTRLLSTDNLYPQEVEALKSEFGKIASNATSNLETLFKYSWKWLSNGLSKLKLNKPDYSVTMLDEKFRDKAALIVSAGPSLDVNIETIKNNRSKYIIFCVNVAYKKLITNGITPDFVLYIDAPDLSDTISRYEHSKTNIISHIASNPNLFDKISPNKFFTFYCQNDILSRWISKTTGFSIEKCRTKGSSSYIGLQAAYNMGCNPIILTGQDLAYTGGKTYSSGSFWEENTESAPEDEESKAAVILRKKKEQIREGNRVKVKGQNGESLDTSRDYAGFIKHFEEFAEENAGSANLINCSTGGAEIKGFKNKDLQEVSDTLAETNMDLNEYINNITETETCPVRENIDKIHEQLDLLDKTAIELIPIAKKGVEASKNLYQTLQKRPVNHSQISKMSNTILNNYKIINEKLYDKWEFSIALAFRELTEFTKLLEQADSKNDTAMFNELASTSRQLFRFTKNRLIRINKEILPKVKEQEEEELPV